MYHRPPQPPLSGVLAATRASIFSFQPYIIQSKNVLNLMVGLGLVLLATAAHHLAPSTQALGLDPLSEEVIVTATVADNLPPTTPILIHPENGSYETTSRPTFIWEGSTDTNGIGEYELYLDGVLLYNNIPTSAVDNSEYTLTYDSVNHEYTLIHKSDIADGTHTWKIRANDTLGNGTDSATWSFTIDTQAPSFVVTQVGTATVSISAQDLSTIPEEPIELTENEPQLLGTGEANSTVQLTVTIPGDPTQNFTGTIDVNGNWGQLLGILPREVVITLDFVITDQAGNISVLSGVQFIIRQEVIVIPPTSPSPSPGATPEATPEPPASPAPSPIITIPITPPDEIVHEIIQEATELIPDPLVAIVTALPPEIIEPLRDSGPISAVLIVSAIPALTLLSLIAQFGQWLSPHLLLRLLQALGLVPAGKKQGWVYDSESHKGIAFALLTVTKVDEELKLPLIETVVTDVDGYYRGLQLPDGTYQIDARHQDYRFPTRLKRPIYLTVEDFYRGEEFVIRSGEGGQRGEKELPSFLIPLDPREEVAEGVEHKSKRTSLRLFLARLSRWSSFLALPMFLISGILTLLFPSLWNWLVFGLYTLMIVYKAVGWFRVPTVSGIATDEEGNPLAGVLIRLTVPGTNDIVAVTTTTERGQFALFVPKQLYILSVIKPGYRWLDQQAITSLYELDLSSGSQHLAIVMAPVTLPGMAGIEPVPGYSAVTG